MKPIKTKILLFFLLFCIVPATSFAVSGSLTTTATVLSKNKCLFVLSSNTLVFGTLNIFSPDTTVPTTLSIRCTGSANPATFMVTDDDGLYDTGPDANRMASGGNFLPYELNYIPSTSIPRNTTVPFDITATVLNSDISAIPPGAYTDRVTLTIVP